MCMQRASEFQFLISDFRPPSPYPLPRFAGERELFEHKSPAVFEKMTDSRSRFLRPQLLPIFQAFLDFAFEAGFLRCIKTLARHAVREIVLA